MFSSLRAIFQKSEFFVGQRVEIRDLNEKWGIGTVTKVDGMGKNIRVRKDGFKNAYCWDEIRIISASLIREMENQGSKIKLLN
jgi:hypothetical protein